MQRTQSHPSDHGRDSRRRQTYGSDVDQLSKEEEWENYFRSRTTVFRPTEDDNASLQVQGSRTSIKRTELIKLKPGDHIGWRRSKGIWHHAIVIETRSANNELSVIHYTKVKRSFKITKKLIEADNEDGKLFRFDYSVDTELKNPAKVVIDRANNLIGMKKYHLLKNNCEHFARYCKTGIRESSQARWGDEKFNQLKIINGAHFVKRIADLVCYIGKKLYKLLLTFARPTDDILAREAIAAQVKELFIAGAHGVKFAGKLGFDTGLEFAKQFPSLLRLLQANILSPSNEALARVQWLAMATTRARNGLQHGSILAKDIVKELAKQSSSTVATGAGKVAVAEGVEAAGQSSNWVGTGIMIGLEALHCVYDIYKISKASKLSSDDFKVEVATRVGEGLGSATGAAIGSYAGGAIGGMIGSAVPIIGTAFGNVVGGVIGSSIGKAVGTCFGRWFGEKWFG